MSSSLIEKSKRLGARSEMILAEPPAVLSELYTELSKLGWSRISWAKCRTCSQSAWTHSRMPSILICVQATCGHIGENPVECEKYFIDLRVMTTH